MAGLKLSPEIADYQIMRLVLETLCILITLSLEASASAIPPVGKRVYLIDSNRSSSPVRIQSSAATGEGVRLKDPIQPKGPIPVRLSQPIKKAKKVERPRRVQVRFSKLPIKGYLKKPAVEFSRDSLPINRVDEPLNSDFFDKVFIPAQDDAY